jgi:hypothetical protein
MAQIPDGPLLEGLKRMYADYDRYGVSWGSALVLGDVWGPRAAYFKAVYSGACEARAKGCLSDWNIRQGGYIFICVVVDQQSRKLTRIATDRDLYRSIIARG